MSTLKDMYVQCSVERREGLSTIHRTFWGNADKAVMGKTVKIEEENGTWTEPWTIVAVHGEPMPREYVQKQSHAHTKQRSRSDI